MKLFELDWLGGAAERWFRRARPGIDELPWGTLSPEGHAPELVEAARASWTEGAYSEYRTAAGFAALIAAMLEAGAPIDLLGMAGTFIADEMTHVELNSRLAMELGGGAPYLVDFATLVPAHERDAPADLRAVELGLRICCVGETFSVPMLAATMKAATHPLVRAVLERLARDEAPHARLGWLLLDWAAERLGAVERAHLAAAARDAIAATANLSPPASPSPYTASEVAALGWLEGPTYRAAAATTLETDVIAPLARRGILV